MDENNKISTVGSTPYDDVFRTMLNDCTRFVLPLLNEVFGEHYVGTEEIVFANDYHFKNMQDGVEEKVITDSSFKVIKEGISKKYHLECQSTIDNSMVLRFFEYDSQIALDDAIIEKVNGKDNSQKSGGILTLTFPHSAVLFLRSNKNTSDVMTMRFLTPGGEIKYNIPIIKMQKYSLQDIWDKEFYLLIPFYIFTHEANFPEYNIDQSLLQQLLEQFAQISRQLSELTDAGKITEFEKRTIIELSQKVIDNIARKYEEIVRGVEKIMGGKVIETEAKRILNRGRSEGQIDKLKDQIKKKLAKGKDISQIADEIEETEEKVIELLEEIEADR